MRRTTLSSASISTPFESSAQGGPHQRIVSYGTCSSVTLARYSSVFSDPFESGAQDEPPSADRFLRSPARR